MTLFLLVLAALIVALQIALTLTLRRVLELLSTTDGQVDALQRRVQSLEQEREGVAAASPPSALFTLPIRADSAQADAAPSQEMHSESPQAATLWQPPPKGDEEISGGRAFPHEEPDGVAELTDLPVLQEFVSPPSADTLGAQVRELAQQGVPVRDIAVRCGLSEAETELFISLRQEPQ